MASYLLCLVGDSWSSSIILGTPSYIPYLDNCHLLGWTLPDKPIYAGQTHSLSSSLSKFTVVRTGDPHTPQYNLQTVCQNPQLITSLPNWTLQWYGSGTNFGGTECFDNIRTDVPGGEKGTTCRQHFKCNL
jgi:hypothetical protein